MAQLKVISNARPTKGKAGGSRSREVTLKYMFGDDGSRAVAVSSVGCTGTTWQEFAAAFAATCAAHGKKPKTELYHLEQSFSREEADPDDPEAAERVNAHGRAFARAAWPGRQVVVVTQKDGKTGLLHNHIAVNNPHTITGLMCRGDDMSWSRLMPLHDQVLASRGHVQPDVMPTTLAQAKQRAKEARELVNAEGRAHVETILAATPATIEAANAVAPEGVELVDEPWEMRAKRGRRPDHGRRMRIKFKDSAGRPHAFDVSNTGITRDQIMAAFEANRAAQQVAPQVETPVSAPAPTEPAQEPAALSSEEFYRLVMADDQGETTPAAVPALAGGLASAPAPAEPSKDTDEEATSITPPVSAPAPTEEAVADAPALATTSEEPYVSPLRGLRAKGKPDPKREALRIGLAAFDEETRARLAAGQRPIEAHAPKGLGPRALAALGQYLDPKVLAQLELRQTKKQARSAAFETGRDLAVELKEMRSAGKQWGDEFQTKVAEREAADRIRKRLESELAAGCYEDVDPEVDRFHAKDREDYVQRGQVALDEALERAQCDRQGGD